MKTKVTTAGRLAGIAVAVGLFAVGATASAQQGSGGAKLLQLGAPKVTATTIAPYHAPMSCPKCRDTSVTIRDTDVQGTGAKTLLAGGTPTKVVAKHLCGSCTNEWTVKGHGKTATAVPVHKCSACG